MRYGLLITAVATVTVPGALAMMGVVGHDRVAAGTTASEAFAGTLAEPLQVAPVTILSRVTAGQQIMGMRLLGAAADAAQATSYQGTELISQSGVGGRALMVSQVWHTGGGTTVVQTSDGTSSSPASSIAVSSSPVGVFGLTKPLVTLLGTHYVAIYQGAGAADGRQATLVDLYRFDGSLAARYWLDRQTAIPLRRELFDTSEGVISEDSFTRVQFGVLTVPRLAGSAQRQSEQAAQAAQPAWVAAASPARFVASLGARGWLLPVNLPGGLPLYAASSASIAGREVADVEYSDGLYVVSLFVQRGTLAPDVPGGRWVRMAGKQAYVAGHAVTWTAAGLVYTMITDASPQTVTEVVGMLPPSGSPGLLGRLLRGFDRLARLINPFG
jgi:sigma-E factor negative regulatory protein RseB